MFIKLSEDYSRLEITKIPSKICIYYATIFKDYSEKFRRVTATTAPVVWDVDGKSYYYSIDYNMVETERLPIVKLLPIPGVRWPIMLTNTIALHASTIICRNKEIDVFGKTIR